MKKRNGFTLVELISLIAIIVLLVSIFLPSVQNIKQQTNSVCCQYNPWNDIILSPVELVIVSPDDISGRPTIVCRFLLWEQIPENPDLYNSYDSNLWICDIRCSSDTCWIPHNCINQSADNSKGIVSGSLVNKIE